MPAMPMAESNPPIVVGIKADEQRDEYEDGLLRAGVDGEWLQRDHSEQEDNRKPCEQDVQSNLVRSLLALRTFNQCNHSIKEGLARVGRDLDADHVREHSRAAGYCGAVAAGFSDDGSGLTGDCGLVDRGDAFNDLAVAWESSDWRQPARRLRNVALVRVTSSSFS